jgi:uncharacterized protein with PQ loop repeat
MDLKIFLNVLGSITAIFSNLVPLTVIYSKRKSEEILQIPIYYFYISHIGFIFWLVYSLNLLEAGLIVVYSFNTLSSFTCIVMFSYYKARLWQFFPEYIIISLVSASFCLSLTSLEYLGTGCTIFCILSSLSDLESVLQIIVTQNHECINLKMTLSNLLNGAIWTTYGILIMNWTILLSNSVLVLVEVVLLALHVAYRCWKGKEAYN